MDIILTIYENINGEDFKLELDHEKLLKYIDRNGIYSIMNYDIPLDFILNNLSLFPKDLLLKSNIVLTEEFIEKVLELEYLILDDIFDININSYDKFSQSFINKFKDDINWERMILIFSNSNVNILDYEDIIIEKNLWYDISSCDLPIEFIKKYKDKFDWRLLTLIQNFTDDDKKELSDYIYDLTSDNKQVEKQELDLYYEDILHIMNKNSIDVTGNEIS